MKNRKNKKIVTMIAMVFALAITLPAISQAQAKAIDDVDLGQYVSTVARGGVFIGATLGSAIVHCIVGPGVVIAGSTVLGGAAVLGGGIVLGVGSALLVLGLLALEPPYIIKEILGILFIANISMGLGMERIFNINGAWSESLSFLNKQGDGDKVQFASLGDESNTFDYSGTVLDDHGA